MHWFALLIIPNDTEDIKRKTSELLRPFDLNLEVASHKDYFHFRLVNRWKKRFNTDDPAVIAELLSTNWPKFDEIRFDEQGLYHITTYNFAGYWDAWCYAHGDLMLGKERWNHCIETHNVKVDWSAPVTCNQCRVEELPSDICPISIISPDGVWHDIDQFSDRSQLEYEFTEEQILAWREYIHNLFNKYSDHLAIGLDFHG